MYEGRFVGSFPAAEAEIGQIELLMTGGGEDDDRASGDTRPATVGTASDR